VLWRLVSFLSFGISYRLSKLALEHFRIIIHRPLQSFLRNREHLCNCEILLQTRRQLEVREGIERLVPRVSAPRYEATFENGLLPRAQDFGECERHAFFS
jgi:hypothetical protein